jgi:endonuclease YncB( thermonuclease family)
MSSPTWFRLVVLSGLLSFFGEAPAEPERRGPFGQTAERKEKPKIVRERLRGQWRHPGEQRVRITGRVSVIDANTLCFEDGTRFVVAGTVDAPDLEQPALLGTKLYSCGRDAAEFLRKLIDDRPVSFYAFGEGGDRDADKRLRGVCFVGETNLGMELVRNGWAIAHHSSMTPYEILAREHKRGLWRGRFLLPELWRKGQRLPEEKGRNEVRKVASVHPACAVERDRQAGEAAVAFRAARLRTGASRRACQEMWHFIA